VEVERFWDTWSSDVLVHIDELVPVYMFTCLQGNVHSLEPQPAGDVFESRVRSYLANP